MHDPISDRRSRRCSSAEVIEDDVNYDELEVTKTAARFLHLAQADIIAINSSPEALDDRMPGVLEKKTLLTMTHLWDARAWEAHRSAWRWYEMIAKWPYSSILWAMRVPLYGIMSFTVTIIVLNWQLARLGLSPLTLPLAPLSLQAASIGLLVVFRNNQTHDRLKEAQHALGSLRPIARDIMQILVVNADPAASRDIAHAARLLALFGWALKFEARGEEPSFCAIASVLNPKSFVWILGRPHWAASVLLRLRAVVGVLRDSNKLSSDAFKFVEERLAKLSAVDATCTRLTTFPVPPSYHRHGSRSIILWLGSLPFVLEGLGCHPVQTLIAVACTTFVLLGVDQISMEVEQPLDVLPLHAFARGMSTEVLRVIESWATMPALPKLEDDDSDLGQSPKRLVEPVVVDKKSL